MKNFKHRQTIHKLESLNSFKTLKQIKTNSKITSTNNLAFIRRNSLFNSFGKNQGDFISTRLRHLPKNLKSNKNDINSKEIKKLPPLKLIEKHARDKIKKEYITPFITRLINTNIDSYKLKKDEDKPIFYNLFKINEIIYNKRSKFNINFLETNIFLSENEYLIKSFKKNEIRIILRYLLGYIFIKDENSQSLIDKYNHKKKNVYDEFFEFIKNNYTSNDSEDKTNNIQDSQRISEESMIITKNLLILSTNSERDKINYPFLKSSNYFLIKDMPKTMVPNSIPNYYYNDNMIRMIIKKFAFYKKYSINYDLLKNANKKNFFDVVGNEMNSSYITSSRSLSIIDKISDDSNSKDQGILKKNTHNGILRNNKDKYINTHNNEIESIQKLIKNLDKKKEEKKVHFEKKEDYSKQKKHITIKKKKIIRQAYEDYEINQTDNFCISKMDKSNILKLLSKEMFNLTDIKLRNKTRHKTRLYIKPDRKLENIKTLSNEKFKRKNRFFLTHTNHNFFINNEFSDFNQNRNKLFETYKKNILENGLNTLNSNKTNNNKNIKLKVFNNLVKQKKIRFSIKPKINIIKFKETSLFISRIYNSVKEKSNTKTLIKEIIINYQKNKNKNDRKTNSLNYPDIYKFGINNFTDIKRIKINKKNKNITKNFRKDYITSTKLKLRDSFNIADIFRHKKIKI